tara:strand:+ start:6166 stop:6513 length:348 start_codon:yes stop_codon:yes gene_type:complete
MKLTTTVKPFKTTGSSKDIIRSKIGAHGLSISKHYSGATNIRNPETVIMINYEKHRPVKSQSNKTYDGKKGKVRKTKIEKNGHWVAYYYYFPIALLKSLNIRVVQKSRNFFVEQL